MQKLKPLPKQLLVRPAVREDTELEGGIILPGDKSAIPQQATIVEIGKDVNPMLKIGQKIIYQKFQGEPITLEKTEYIIMPELAILGIIEEVEENG